MKKEPKLGNNSNFASLKGGETRASSLQARKRSYFSWVLVVAVLAACVWTIYHKVAGGEPNIAILGGEKSSTETMAVAQNVAKPKAPSFDIVRMEKGEAVVSGRAEPNALVHIMEATKELGTAKADARGEWVFLPAEKLAAGERKLSLYVVDANGNRVEGAQPAILVVSPEKPSEELAVAVGKGQKTRVLQAPAGSDIGSLRISKLEYSEGGHFSAEGVAASTHSVNVYSNGELVDNVKVSDGKWALKTSHKLVGATVLRVDMVAESGKVAKRIEYKFTPIFIEEQTSAIVLRKGDCLWNIAVREYGKGADYLVLFEANKSVVRDPNRVYARQVIAVPEKGGKYYETYKAKETAREPRKPKSAGAAGKAVQ